MKTYDVDDKDSVEDFKLPPIRGKSLGVEELGSANNLYKKTILKMAKSIAKVEAGELELNNNNDYTLEEMQLE